MSKHAPRHTPHLPPPKGLRRALVTPEVMAVVAPLLEEHDVTDAEWIAVSRTKAASAVRGKAVLAFRAMGWSTAVIAKAIGFDTQSVRRTEIVARGGVVKRYDAPPGGRKPVRALPVVVEGRAMRAEAGPRYDCIYDGACLESLLAAFPRATPPREASCTPNCQWRKPPDRDQQRYDATRRLW